MAGSTPPTPPLPGLVVLCWVSRGAKVGPIADEKQKNAPRQSDAHRGRVEGVGRSSGSLANDTKRGGSEIDVRRRPTHGDGDSQALRNLREVTFDLHGAMTPEQRKLDGRRVAAILRLIEEKSADVAKDVAQRITEPIVARMIEELRSLGEKIALVTQKIDHTERVNFPIEVERMHIQCIREELRSKCPACKKNTVVPGHGRFDGNIAHRDHFRERHLSDLGHTWIICPECHKRKTSGKESDWAEAHFKVYQITLREFLKRLPAQQRLL